jgi:hypothetical protein
VTTVGALSEIGFLIRVGLPVDAGCKLKITFPSDMPLTNDLTYISAPSITSSTTPQLSVSSNYFIITGCSAYAASTQNDYSLDLQNVKNKGYVQGTTSFTV